MKVETELVWVPKTVVEKIKQLGEIEDLTVEQIQDMAKDMIKDL